MYRQLNNEGLNNKESAFERKKSLRDSTSLDPKLKVNKSINFDRKNSNGGKENKMSISSNKHFAINELNRSIESVVIKDKSESSIKNENPSTLKNMDKIKGKISIFKDPNGVRIMKKKGKEYKNWYSPSIIQNNKNELYSIQEEKEFINEPKDNIGVWDSAISSTQDTKDNKNEDLLTKGTHKRASYKHDNLIKISKPEFESSIINKMERTDGFIAFKPSIGGNSSNSLLPSSSGDTFNK